MAKGDISAVEYVLRLIFPPRCICCDLLLPIHTPKEICSRCEEALPLLKKCLLRNPAGGSVGRIFSAFEYEGGIRKAIHDLKFNDRPSNASVLVDISIQCLEGILCEQTYFSQYSEQFQYMHSSENRDVVSKNTYTYDVIIPVPIHHKRKRQRGYNQSELICNRISKLLATPIKNRILVKAIHTAPQSTLDREERLGNLTNAYRIKNTDFISGKKILLVDDIMTTGSTLEQCARALKDAGAAQVDGFVLAVRR